MHRKVGVLASFLFIILATVTYMTNGGFFRANVAGVYLPGVLYSLSIFKGSFFKGYQLALTVLLGCFALALNDVNSMISLVVFSVVLTMCNKYYPTIKWLSYIMTIPFILTAIISGWTLVNIFLTTLIFMGYTTVGYVINNDKEETKTTQEVDILQKENN